MNALFDRIAAAGHIVLIVHRHPDADSLGSASAMYTHLVRLEKRVTLFCPTSSPDRRLEYLPWFDKIRHTFPADAELAIAFDCAGAARMGVVPGCDLVNIDHHPSNDGFGTLALVDPEAISTTALLYALFKEAGIRINAKMATALYAGLFDDSDSFSAPRVGRETFEMAADLAACGADLQSSSLWLMHRTSLAATRLKGVLLQELQLFDEGRIAVLHVKPEHFERTGARPLDCEGALHEGLCLSSVETVLLIRERGDGSFKVSLRGEGTRDLGSVAAGYGGGGHRHSAGFETRCESARHLLGSLLERLGKFKSEVIQGV